MITIDTPNKPKSKNDSSINLWSIYNDAYRNIFQQCFTNNY